MHTLIVGSRGQMGSALQAHLAQISDWRVTAWTRADHDVTDANIARAVAELGPDVVINAAAWTDVDSAEANAQAAYAVNALAPRYLAAGCVACDAELVQISTNEVFAGEPGCRYREYDLPDPGGVYARSKLAGERAASQLLRRLYIVRIAWLFGPTGSNFPAKIAAAADRLGALRVVSDEVGNPTYAPDAADAIVRLLMTKHYGNYHIVNGGCASRFQVAELALRASGREHIPLTPISAAEWPRPSSPPPHAVLINQAAAALGISLRPWQEALTDYAKNCLE